MSIAPYAPCCFRGFQWDGTPTGRIDKLANNDAYIAGSTPDRAVLLIHDALGWTFPNIRLLADHYAKEANATVYVPDFFGGEVKDPEMLIHGSWADPSLDMPGFLKRNARDIREPEIFETARALRAKYKKVGAVGFCFGGWAVFRLGAKEHQPPLVDCITCGHPTWLTKKDIDEVAVPLQVLAPEHDRVYTPELKLHTFETVQKLGVPFDYQFFPGVEHACFNRGNKSKPGELAAMVRGKNAAVDWLIQFLGDAPLVPL
jgi:dienelactone hydrolase